MPAPLPPRRDNCDCGWREYALSLEVDIAHIKSEIELLKRRSFGRKSEKMPSMERQLRNGKKADPDAILGKRREAAAQKEGLVTEVVPIPVPSEQCRCPACGTGNLRPIGPGKPSSIYEYVPGYFRRRLYVRETLRCTCGEYIVTAPCPEKSTEKTQYSPSFVAHLMVSKCGDSMPLYRLEKHYGRLGIPIARSTMNDLLHRNAELLAPLWKRLLALIAASVVVMADETTIRVMGSKKRAYMWTFLSDTLIAYQFSLSRSSETPRAVLGGTTGTLVVDAYTGYNRVTAVGGRERAGCLAHARRKLFEASSFAPEAQTALALIRDLYVVEHEAKERGVAKTADHLAMRQARSRPLMNALSAWLVEQEPLHPPKSPLGRAIGYARKNWQALTRFLDDAAIPPDNNASEAALRIVALGRKNFLFVGNEDAGENIAGLYSLISTCAANGVNPLEYLTDVLLRVQTHPAERIDELLPHRWQRPAA